MAGMDKQFDGVARLTQGFVAGYLPQEPQLNPEKDVQGNVDEAVASRRVVLDHKTKFDGTGLGDRRRKDAKAVR